eukprot:GEMP01087341.1.p1 GENE.GEMP01087341.1~~GEMP01087341.1.p1  ORF type:complete len:139 (-),score=10.63 GEMP01087341.1:422-838(-)
MWQPAMCTIPPRHLSVTDLQSNLPIADASFSMTVLIDNSGISPAFYGSQISIKNMPTSDEHNSTAAYISAKDLHTSANLRCAQLQRRAYQSKSSIHLPTSDTHHNSTMALISQRSPHNLLTSDMHHNSTATFIGHRSP